MKLSILFTGFVFVSVATFAASPGPAPTKREIDAAVAQAAKIEPGQNLRCFRQLEDWVRLAPSDNVLRTELEGGFIRLLSPGATFEARRFACTQLGIIGTEMSLPTLVAMLNQTNTVSIACLALTTYPPGKTDEALRKAVVSATGLVRLQLIRTLGDRRDSGSLSTLSAAVRDPDPAIAGAAVTALGKIGGREAWRLLSILRQTAKPELKPLYSEATLRCAAGLAASGDRKTAAAFYESLLGGAEPDYIRRCAFAALTRLDADQGQSRILTVLRSGDPFLRPVAISVARDLRGADASAELAKELPKLQPNEQVWLIDTLAARNDSTARAAIGHSLASPAPAVRRAAIAALGRVGDSRTVGLLAPMLRSPHDADETRQIQAALIELGGGARTDDAIRSELKTANGAPRACLIAVLSQRIGIPANPLLLKETDNSDPVVAKAACRALGRTATAAEVPALLLKLLGVLDPAVRPEAETATAQALARIEPASNRSSMIRASLGQTTSPVARASLLGLLPVCGDGPALDALTAAVADADPKVSEAAIQALAEWPDPTAWQPLVGIYRKPANEASRATALRGLVRIAGDENARAGSHQAERYMELLQGARGDADLKLILGALGGAAQPEALQLALPLLSNAGIRPEAEVAVKKIAQSIKAKYPDAAKDALEKLQRPQ